MNPIIKTTISLISLFFLCHAGAAESVMVEDHSYPVQKEAHGERWVLKGTEHFKYRVFFSVFTAGLYEQVDGEGVMLTFTYTRDLKADDLREQAMKTLTANNDKQTLEKYKHLTKQIQEAYVNVKDGDSYSVTAVPGKGTWLGFNGEDVFFTENAEFGDWYLDIWLGDPPISESLKKALLKERR